MLSIIGIMFSIYFSFSFSGENVYSVETFKSGDGWGYQINKNEKVIILQPHMPCIQGDKPFPDQRSALEVGQLVTCKIKKNEDPTVTMEELNEKVSRY